MTKGVGPVDSIRPVGERRERSRRQTERREGEGAMASTSRDLVPVGERIDHPTSNRIDPAKPAPAPVDPAAGAAIFAAQMIGQTGQRKGIRGGPPVLDAARSTYLGTEYSGEAERRPPVGTTKRTDV